MSQAQRSTLLPESPPTLRENRGSSVLSVLPKNKGVEIKLLGWDGEDDPENPRNWALWRKGVVVGIIAAITFFSPLASSMFAPGIPSVMETFGETNESLGTFCVSVYILVHTPLWKMVLTFRVSLVGHYYGLR